MACNLGNTLVTISILWIPDIAALLAQQFRNDKEKRVVIPEFREAKYPGSRERFSSAR